MIPASKAQPAPTAAADGGESREGKLLARLAAGDSAAMVDFYQVASAPLYGAALRMLGNESDAEEALQDALMRIWERASSFDPSRSRPLTWSLMILRGLCMDRLRRRLAGKRRADTVPLEALADLPAGDAGIVRTLFVHESLRRVQDAMARLDPRERRCIEMAVFGQISHTEIAGRTDEPLGTVKTRIRRGFVKLRAMLGNERDY